MTLWCFLMEYFMVHLWACFCYIYDFRLTQCQRISWRRCELIGSGCWLDRSRVQMVNSSTKTSLWWPGMCCASLIAMPRVRGYKCEGHPDQCTGIPGEGKPGTPLHPQNCGKKVRSAKLHSEVYAKSPACHCQPSAIITQWQCCWIVIL